MLNTKEKVQKDVHLRQYSDLINKIAKVEYRSMGTQYLIEFDELINIGFQTINILCEQKEFKGYNESYLSTAIKWAIRNEVRRRYKWYVLKNHQEFFVDEENQSTISEAVYKTILSVDEMAEGDNPTQIRDFKRNPDEVSTGDLFK